MKRLTDQDRARAELAKRGALEFTAASLCAPDKRDHEKQFAYLTCPDPYAIALCSRRAGKSFANMGLLALTALARPGVTALYLGLTEKAVKYTIVKKLWDRIVSKYQLPFTAVNSEMVAECTTNGSLVRFGSVDDIAHVVTYLGDDLAEGVVIIDEAQSIPRATLQPLVESVIIPALSSTTDEHPEPGKLRLTGTVPPTANGYFYHAYVEENGWRKFNWSRFDNPFLREQHRQLADVCVLLGITEDDPRIQRDWFGRLVFSANDTAYHYDHTKHTYAAEGIERVDIGPFHCLFTKPSDLDRFIVGIDPAQRKDRFAFVCWGWNHRRKDRLYQVAEAVTDPGADPLESEWLNMCAEMKRRYAA